MVDLILYTVLGVMVSVIAYALIGKKRVRVMLYEIDKFQHVFLLIGLVSLLVTIILKMLFNLITDTTFMFDLACLLIVGIATLYFLSKHRNNIKLYYKKLMEIGKK